MKGNSQKMKQRPRNQKPPFKQNTCPWCGDTPHPKGKDDCPAKGKQCYACSRLDHLGKVCLHPNPNWRKNRGQPTNSHTPGRPQADSVRFTDAESTLVDNFCLDTIYSNAVNERRRGKKYFTFLEVKAKPQSSTTTIRFQIDSGATCNVLPHRYIKQLGNPPLEPSTSIMNMYNNNHVKPQGILHLECRKNGLNLTLPFQVIDRMQFTDKPPLLYGSDSEKLQLLSITADEVNSIQNETLSEAMLRNKYHDVFH